MPRFGLLFRAKPSGRRQHPFIKISLKEPRFAPIGIKHGSSRNSSFRPRGIIHPFQRSASAENVRGFTRLISFLPADPEANALAGPLLLRTAGIRQHSFLSLYPFDFPEEWRAFLLQPRMVEFAPSQKHCPPAGAGSALSEARRRFGSGRMPSGQNRKLLGLL